MDGEGQLTLTGQLGDVMKESAHLAISWLRSNAKKYHLTNGEWPSPGRGTAVARKSRWIVIREASHSSVARIKMSFKLTVTPPVKYKPLLKHP